MIRSIKGDRFLDSWQINCESHFVCLYLCGYSFLPWGLATDLAFLKLSSKTMSSTTPVEQSVPATSSLPKCDRGNEISNVLQEGRSKDEIKSFYTDWASKEDGGYDEYMVKVLYRAPYLVAKAVKDNCPDKNIRILDIACGTGFVGEHLEQYGFSNVDGMDATPGMLEKAKAKNVYKNYICSTIGSSGSTDVPENTYDVITIAGGFGPGHIPCEAVDEMIRIVKPGGYIFNVTRVEHLFTFSEYKDKWEPYIMKKEKEGKWKEIFRTIYKNYIADKDGILYMHKVL